MFFFGCSTLVTKVTNVPSVGSPQWGPLSGVPSVGLYMGYTKKLANIVRKMHNNSLWKKKKIS